jgi:hypothetical protein
MEVKAFPSALQMRCLQTQKTLWHHWDAMGPVSPFTVEQNLEKKALYVYGQAKQGYFRFVLRKEKQDIVLLWEKCPFPAQSPIILAQDAAPIVEPSQEHLFLGSNKQKDFYAVRKRKDLREILPIWHALGKMFPRQGKEEGPIFDLLSECEAKISRREKDVESLLLKLYLAGFSQGFVPRGFDSEWQGIISASKDLEAFSLLQRGSSMISSLFFQEKEGVYAILPCLASLFVSGRITHSKTTQGCHIHMEWTKSRLRKMILFAEKNCTFTLDLPKEIKDYRVRNTPWEKGVFLDRKESIRMFAGSRIYLDRFLK